MSILYFLPETALRSRSIEEDGVYLSQCVEPARYLRSLGLQVGLWCSLHRPSASGDSFIRLLESEGIELHIRTHRGGGVWWLLAEMVRLRRWLRRSRWVSVYSRNYICSAFSRVWRVSGKCQLVYDVRGSELAEMRMSGAAGSASLRLKQWLWARGLREADRVLAVSQALSDECAQLGGIAADHVIPCCVSPSRFSFEPEHRRRLRAHYGIPEDGLLFAYSGGLAPHQNLPRTAYLANRLLKEDPGIWFAFLVPASGREYVTSLLEGRSQENRVILESVPQESVSAYLSAADVGVMLRADDQVNRVACPTKFAEYLACGLPVVTTPFVLDVARVVDSEQLGLLVDPADDRFPGHVRKWARGQNAESLARLRQRCMEMGASRFQWGAYRDILTALHSPPEGGREA